MRTAPTYLRGARALGPRICALGPRICALGPLIRSLGPRIWLSLGAAVSVLALAGVGAPAASAWSDIHGKVFVLEVVEGENTVPEFGSVAKTVARTEGSDPQPQVAVSIVKNGITVYKEEGQGWASVPQVPQAGETVVLESPVGHVVGSAVYDGMPTIDPSTCVGSTTFEGENTSGFTVEGSYVIDSLVTPYKKSTELAQSGFQQAQVKSLTGTSFGGSFLRPIPAGATVTAEESLKTPLGGEANLPVRQRTRRNRPTDLSLGPSAPAAAATARDAAAGRAGGAPARDDPPGPQGGVARPREHQPGRHGHPGSVSPRWQAPRGGRLLAQAPQDASGAAAGAWHRPGRRDGNGARGAEAHARGTAQAEVRASVIDAILVTTLRTSNGQIDTLSPHAVTLKR